MKAQVTWKCFHLRNSQRTELDRKSAFESSQILKEEEIELKNRSVIAWEISSLTLLYGLYYVELTVQMNNLSNCVNYNYAFLRVKESPLQPVIAVRPAVKILLQGYNKELTLNAAGSFDPDEPNSNESTFEYTWLCARKNEAFTNIALLPVVVPNDSKTVAKGCYGTGPGKLNFTGSKATLFLDKMATEKGYVITMVLRKGERTTNLSYTFFLNRTKTIGVKIK